MASSTLSLTLLLALAALAHANSEVFAKAAEKCNEHIKAPESAVESFKEMENLDESKEGKCLVECVLKGLELISEDGTMNKEKGGEMILKAYVKPETQAKVKEIFESCSEKAAKESEPCEHAFAFLQCYYNESHKENLPKPHEEKH